MADEEGPALSPNQNQNQNLNQNPNKNPIQNPNQKQNQVPDRNLPPNQNFLSPLNPFMPNAPLAPEAPQRSQLNWSHFKPDYTGRPDKDAEAHLLRTNNWMDTHEFPEHIKVQRFCLTLVGEAGLWYESLRLINVDWVGLQKIFRQQYSKIGNSREQLFHAWRSFQFDENVEMTDTYVNHIRQVATHLGYQEPQILDIFKYTLPTKLYWVLFPIMDLRQVVETAKRVLTKEKIGRQLAVQNSSTPFMNMRNNHNKRVTFNTTDDIEQKLDKLTVMMGKSVTEDGQSKQFKS